MPQQVDPIAVDDTLQGGLVVTDISPSGRFVSVTVPTGFRLVGTQVVPIVPDDDTEWSGAYTGILTMAQAEKLFVAHAP